MILTFLNRNEEVDFTIKNGLKYFPKHFSGLLNKITDKEKESLSLDIEALKRKEIKLSDELIEKVSFRKTQLFAEKNEIPTLIENYSEDSKNLFIRLSYRIKVFKLKRWLKNLNKNLDKLAENPFRKIKKKIKKKIMTQ